MTVPDCLDSENRRDRDKSMPRRGDIKQANYSHAYFSYFLRSLEVRKSSNTSCETGPAGAATVAFWGVVQDTLIRFARPPGAV